MEPNENKADTAGVVALIVSVVLPLIGVIIYFVNRKKVVNAANYLYCAFAGCLIDWLVLQ